MVLIVFLITALFMLTITFEQIIYMKRNFYFHEEK